MMIALPASPESSVANSISAMTRRTAEILKGEGYALGRFAPK